MSTAARPSLALLLFVAAALPWSGRATEPGRSEVGPVPLHVPEGFEVELVAGPPLVEYPIAASFDDQGRLYVAESSGEKRSTDEMAKKPTHFIRVIEDTDGDGKFDKGRVFATGLTFPEGVLWYDGAVYTASPPFVWKFQDSTGAGVADKRQQWQTGFIKAHCANEGHGPYLGPDGRIYWAKGGFSEHNLKGARGRKLTGKASHVFRCRPDGSEVEAVLTGGMDNPVGIAWTPEGELLFSCTFYTNPNQGLRDALLHGIEGGLYPKVHGVLAGHKRTGDYLPALAQLGVAAPAGITAYQPGAFGLEYSGNVFSAQFNMHKVQRHVLTRSGATFTCKTEDFLTSTSVDFHPTDVLEDADGSLLVVNTGGWYMICCPTSQLAKPQVKGGIYRIRKKGAPRPDDPRGLSIPWQRHGPTELAALLDDPRFAVRNKAVHLLGKQGERAVPALRRVAREGKSTLSRRNALWALTRIDGEAARTTVRAALEDRDASVRQTAAYSAGLHRDGEARALLTRLLADLPPIRREAATALGRIADPSSIQPLLTALKPDDDRFLEHSLIWALIEIGDRPSLVKALASESALARRAAVIALDQSDDGSLKPQVLTPLLSDADGRVQAAVLDAIAGHPAWGKEMLEVVRGLLAKSEPTTVALQDVRRLLVAFSRDPAAQEFVANKVEARETSPQIRQALLEVMSQAPLRSFPAAWRQPLIKALNDPDDGVVRQAVATLRALPDARTAACVAPLLDVAEDGRRADDLRAAAFAGAAPLASKLAESAFAFLLGSLEAEKPPLLRATAAEALGLANLSADQLGRLAGALPTAGPLELPRLLAAFEKGGDATTGRALVTALNKAPAVKALRPAALTQALAKYPDEVRQAAAPLLASLAGGRDKQLARLEELSRTLGKGEPQRGRQVFLGARATCVACHSIGGQGGQVGPDLTKIGAIRSQRDLLEAIVFPSASFVRGYEPYQVTTKDGKVYAGVIRRETADGLVLATGAATEARIARAAIEEIVPAKVSIMPEGLDTQLGRQELSDLIAYLMTLK